MSINAISQSSFRKNLKFIILGATICILFAGIMYTSLWSFAKRNAEQAAVKLSESISPPGSTAQIRNWRGSNGTSFECYSGFSSTLYGSNLPLTEVLKYYRNDFRQRGWDVDNGNVLGENGKILDVEKEDILIMGTGKDEIDYYINVSVCRSSYCSGFPPIQEDHDLINTARKQYETVYWLSIVYKPENVRNNMCGCCDGG